MPQGVVVTTFKLKAMINSNLLKGLATIAVTLILTSCGGIKTKEVILEDCVKIPSQRLNLELMDYSDEEEEDFDIEVAVKMEALEDIKWKSNSVVKMQLLDENGKRLTTLIQDEVPEKKGDKVVSIFSLTLSSYGEGKEELEKIIANTRDVKFKSDIK